MFRVGVRHASHRFARKGSAQGERGARRTFVHAVWAIRSALCGSVKGSSFGLAICWRVCRVGARHTREVRDIEACRREGVRYDHVLSSATIVGTHLLLPIDDATVR